MNFLSKHPLDPRAELLATVEVADLLTDRSQGQQIPGRFDEVLLKPGIHEV